MQIRQEPILIAQCTEELRQFIFDLAGHTLDKAGYEADIYAFHLHVAFRRNMILEPLELSFPVKLGGGQSIKNIEIFTQKLVDEVQEAERDCWAIKLVKSEYLSYLDKSRNACEHGLRLLSGHVHSKISISGITVEDEDRQCYIDLLHANLHFSDVLLTLPFVLEKTCRALSINTGINYDPRKSAALLAACLDTANLHLKQDALIDMLKFAIRTTMPSIPLDDNAIETIQNILLPTINLLIKAEANLKEKKEALLSDQSADARKLLLSHLGVHIDSLQEITIRTVLVPIQHVKNVIYDFQGFVLASYKACRTDKERLLQIGKAFLSFDNFVNRVNHAQQPLWLTQINDYYQAFRKPVLGRLDTLREGLGIFYNRLVSYIPLSILNYFQAGSVIEQIFSYPNADVALVYLDFYTLAKEAELTAALEMPFFEAYVTDIYKKLPKDFEYSDYQAFIKQHNSKLQESMTDLAMLMNNQNDFDLIWLIHRLKQHEIIVLKKIENQTFDDKDMQNLLSAWEKETNEPRIQRFKSQFLQPALERITLAYLKMHYLAKLVEVIDSEDLTANREALAELNCLTLIYSQLSLGTLISQDQFTVLQRVFGNNPLHLLLPQQVPQVAIQCTAKQINKQHIKTNVLPYIQTMLRHVSEALDKQSIDCRNLNALVGDSSIGNLCQAKIKYIQTLKGLVNLLMQEIQNDPDKIAKFMVNMHENMDAQKVVKAALDIAPTTVIDKLLRFAWYVYPDAKEHSSLLSNILHYYFKDTLVLELYQSEQEYSQVLASAPCLTFMNSLSHPLAITHFMPSEEALMDSFFEEIIRQGGQYFSVKVINNFAAALPYPFLGAVFKSLISPQWVSDNIHPLLQEYAGVYTDNAKRMIKNRLYPLLGVAMQGSVEESAYRYAKSLQDSSVTTTEKDIDAFAMYYLQYRSLKDANPSLEFQDCINLLFPCLAESTDLEFMLKAFADTDKLLLQNQGLEKDLQFLINNLDLSDKKNDRKIQLILINKYLLLTFEAAEQVNTIMAQEQGFAMVTELLKKIPHGQQKIQEFFTLQPSIKKGVSVAGSRLLSRLDPLIQKLDGSLRNRKSLKEFLTDNFGKTVLEVEYEKAKGNDPYRVYAIVSILVECLVVACNYTTLYLAFQLSVGGMQSLYILFGITSAVGVAATQAGLALFVLVLVASFLIKFIGEIYSYRHEFNALSDEKYSPWERFGIGLLYVTICFLNAFSMTFMMDFIVATFAKYLPLDAFKKLWKAFHVYPNEADISHEEQLLQDLKSTLEAVKQQIKGSDLCSESLKAIIQNMRDIKQKLTSAAQDEIMVLQPHYQTELHFYQQEFQELEQLARGLLSLQEIQHKTEMKAESISTKAIELSKADEQKIIVDTHSYCQERYAKVDKTQASVQSHFYEYLAKVGQLFSWRRPTKTQCQALENSMSTSSWLKSAVLMSSKVEEKPQRECEKIADSQDFIDAENKTDLLAESLLGFDEACEEVRSSKLI